MIIESSTFLAKHTVKKDYPIMRWKGLAQIVIGNDPKYTLSKLMHEGFFIIVGVEQTLLSLPYKNMPLHFCIIFKVRFLGIHYYDYYSFLLLVCAYFVVV